MNAKIVFKLLTGSQFLARVLALHGLRKADAARPAVDNLPAVRVHVLGLINVWIDLETDSLRHVRSELAANHVVFSLDSEFPNTLVGRIGLTPCLRIILGHKRTLHLMIVTAARLQSTASQNTCPST